MKVRPTIHKHARHTHRRHTKGIDLSQGEGENTHAHETTTKDIDLTEGEGKNTLAPLHIVPGIHWTDSTVLRVRTITRVHEDQFYVFGVHMIFRVHVSMYKTTDSTDSRVFGSTYDVQSTYTRVPYRIYSDVL